MTYRDFKQHSVRQQIYLIHQRAHFLTITKAGDLVTRLYALDKFYVEYQYDIVSLEVYINAFEDTNKLAGYLDEVILPTLI
uniref:Uncharacterized protein n=1 Tax=Roseihalotalea indica TaxID=2867963 RepID=A0AA49GML7_9BACT|nr:hypothetical protein K4G66_02825 [Tunicatimonas sp. TK19036]